MNVTGARRGRRLALVEKLKARGIQAPRLLAAFGQVPRHLFVEEALADQAYEDCSLPLGEKQTISQPSMVALMLSLLAVKPTDRVLEIGTGSGYQTALLGHLADQVYSMERIAALARPASRRLREMGLTNVHVKTFDGTYGWRDRAPFQGIIVTAGAPKIPRTLAEQLAEGGRMVVPVGEPGTQVLKRIFRDGTGFRVEDHGTCQFVPLIGRFGWEESGGR
ncbi:MAG: protein-L-isoaspartate(D-aspartate) O-methyltransferase [Acidobacteria bacterium]|jgi:protein-L-isoaspartate(D-aspartate) O-methyltransferase|nr:protein-L-isoaspartate(D-aspartate) O-methyltransferase [Acidobacteriota bacterium]MCZ6746823.1 protein-L-isoaspartate(D-aspartate) O-methyltransferase [Acidobacteriota bacterium]